MKVVVLGGYDRMASKVRELSKKYGVDIKFINQETQQNIDSALCKADLVLVFTRLVGHNMVSLAKKYAKDRCVFCNRCGSCALEEELKKWLS
ncbi:DUF2325 domain-containing protein [Thermocrinis sp.]|uniref:DUF2325 domain-containing protein n=1 Tax=Thermocrinis sp. TaxID=2024383 RepID=UPI002FDE574E